MTQFDVCSFGLAAVLELNSDLYTFLPSAISRTLSFSLSSSEEPSGGLLSLLAPGLEATAPFVIGPSLHTFFLVAFFPDDSVGPAAEDEEDDFIFFPGGGGLSLSDPELVPEWDPVASEEEEEEPETSVSSAVFLFL